MGYAEDQIPSWVARPKATILAAPTPDQQQKQAEAEQAELVKQPAPAEIPAPRTGIPRSPAPASAQLASASAPASAPASEVGAEQPAGKMDELVRFIDQNPDFEQKIRKPSYENKGTIITVLFS